MLETCPPTSLLNSFIFQFPQHIYYTVNITGIIPLSICPSWLRMNRIKLLQHRLQQYRMMVIHKRNYSETNRLLHLFSEISFHPPDSRLGKLQWRRTREKRRLVSYSCHRVVALNPNSVFTLMYRQPLYINLRSCYLTRCPAAIQPICGHPSTAGENERPGIQGEETCPASRTWNSHTEHYRPAL